MRITSEIDMVALWASGDERAGRMLVDRYGHALHRFFRRRAEGFEQDLVQRTFLACIEGRSRFRGDSTFRTYLFRTARFLLSTHYRERRRHAELACSGHQRDLFATP